MRVDLLSTAFLRVFVVMIVCTTVVSAVSAQTVIASQDFDTPLNMNSQMIIPDGSAFMDAGDMFDVRNTTSSLPFAITDDTARCLVPW